MEEAVLLSDIGFFLDDHTGSRASPAKLLPPETQDLDAVWGPDSATSILPIIHLSSGTAAEANPDGRLESEDCKSVILQSSAKGKRTKVLVA